MSLPYFYAPGLMPDAAEWTMDETSSRHCVQVLRRQAGDAVILADGRGLKADAQITLADRRRCLLRIGNTERLPEARPRLGLAFAFTKQMARTEWLIEKAAELGIGHIYPLQCQRGERARYSPDRLQHLLVSAMLQSQQAYLPVLHGDTPFDELAGDGAYPCRLLAHCLEGEKTFFPGALQPGMDTLALIGPEGDFTPDEVQRGLRQGCRPVSLGPHRLRTETAGLAAGVWMSALRGAGGPRA